MRNLAIVTALIVALLAGTAAPSRADGQASTRTIILGALAATGIILYNNYEHKRAYANSIVGYTRDGGTVYGDGRIVYPDGTVVYTSNNGSTVCSFDGYGQQCQPGNVYGYYPNGNYAPNYNTPNYQNYQNANYQNANGRNGYYRNGYYRDGKFYPTSAGRKHHDGDNNRGDNQGGNQGGNGN